MSRKKSMVRVAGAQELRRRLKAAGDDLADLKAVHLEIAEAVAAKARTKAPVKTGALKKTIRASGTKTAATVRMGSKRVPYANTVHWGRRMYPNMRAKGTDAKGRSMPFAAPVDANPFVWETAHADEAEIQKFYSEYIDKALEGTKQ